MDAFFLPQGTITKDKGLAAEEWSKAYFEMRDALERIRPIPERILNKIPVRNLDEIFAECDHVLNKYIEKTF